MINLTLGKTIEKITRKMIAKVVKKKFGVELMLTTTNVSISEGETHTEFDIRIAGKVRNDDYEKLLSKLI